MYSATADRGFPSLHIATRQLERRRRNIRCIGFEYAKPFLNAHKIVEHEGGDEAQAWETRGRNADLQWLMNRRAEIFTAAGARVELSGLIRATIETAKAQADSYSKCTGTPRQLRYLDERHYGEAFNRTIGRMRVKK